MTSVPCSAMPASIGLEDVVLVRRLAVGDERADARTSRLGSVLLGCDGCAGHELRELRLTGTRLFPKPASSSTHQLTPSTSFGAMTLPSISVRRHGFGRPRRAERIDQVTRFNRLYTRRIGVLRTATWAVRSRSPRCASCTSWRTAPATASELARELEPRPRLPQPHPEKVRRPRPP